MKWEEEIEDLNRQLARISIIAARSMAEQDYDTAIECFRGMAHLTSEKACRLRKLGKKMRNKLKAELMRHSANNLFSSRGEWLKQAYLVEELAGRHGDSKNNPM